MKGWERRMLLQSILYTGKNNQEDIDFSITNTQHLHVRTDYKIIFSDLDQKSKLACDYLMKRLIISYAAFIQLIHNQDRLGNLKWSSEFIDWDLIKLPKLYRPNPFWQFLGQQPADVIASNKLYRQNLNFCTNPNNCP